MKKFTDVVNEAKVITDNNKILESLNENHLISQGDTILSYIEGQIGGDRYSHYSKEEYSYIIKYVISRLEQSIEEYDYTEGANNDDSVTGQSSVGQNESALIVKPFTPEDKLKIEELIESEGLLADYNSEFNEFSFPEENLDALEQMLTQLFNQHNINATFAS